MVTFEFGKNIVGINGCLVRWATFDTLEKFMVFGPFPSFSLCTGGCKFLFSVSIWVKMLSISASGMSSSLPKLGKSSTMLLLSPGFPSSSVLSVTLGGAPSASAGLIFFLFFWDLFLLDEVVCQSVTNISPFSWGTFGIWMDACLRFMSSCGHDVTSFITLCIQVSNNSHLDAVIHVDLWQFCFFGEKLHMPVKGVSSNWCCIIPFFIFCWVELNFWTLPQAINFFVQLTEVQFEGFNGADVRSCKK